jgi:hypothetical protein
MLLAQADRRLGTAERLAQAIPDVPTRYAASSGLAAVEARAKPRVASQRKPNDFALISPDSALTP